MEQAACGLRDLAVLLSLKAVIRARRELFTGAEGVRYVSPS